MNNSENKNFDPDKTIEDFRTRVSKGELMVGDRIIRDRYKLEEVLGKGAMGKVFLCREQVTRELFAMKMVPPGLSRDDAVMESILENYQLVHKLKHPNIASYDFLEKDEYNAYYVLMEYAEGDTLSAWLRKKGFGESKGAPLTEILPILQQIASALDYAHSQCITHRDIKPANIIVTKNEIVKILDFGLAAKIHSTMSVQNVKADFSSTSTGTPSYMSPEQWKARPSKGTADQYALAVMTYEMLAGYLPFEARDIDTLRDAVKNESPERPDNISDTVWNALSKALSKDPKARFESCTAFVEALKKKSQQTPLPPKTETVITEEKKPLRRYLT